MDKRVLAANTISVVADIEPVTAIFVCRIDSCSDVLYLILHIASWVSGTHCRHSQAANLLRLNV